MTGRSDVVSSAFKTSAGEATYLAAYDDAMKMWPVPYEEMNVPSRFGITHVVVSDVMGQPSKSIPKEPICNAADYAAWLIATLDQLHLDRVFLVGMSYGGWLALNFGITAPERVWKMVLLSPGGGFLPLVRQFRLRGMFMLFAPSRLTVNPFMGWLGFSGRRSPAEARMLELIYLGLKHFRVPAETARVMPVIFHDHQLRAMRAPTLLLIGNREVIWDPVIALARARRVFPDVHGELVPQSSHDMCVSQHRIVDARVLEFFKKTPTEDRCSVAKRSVA